MLFQGVFSATLILYSKKPCL